MEMVVQVPDERLAFFTQLMNELGFTLAGSPVVVKKPKMSAKAKRIAEIKGALQEVRQVLDGKKKAQNAFEFLDSLKRNR